MKTTKPLKPGKPLVRKTPMARTGTLRVASTQLKSRVAGKVEEGQPKPRQVTRMKSRGPKMTPIRRAARNQECQLQILGVCNGDPSTTVLCHSNQLAAGKGMGLKAPDTEACFGCSSCHDVLDGRAPRPAGMSMDDLLQAFTYARKRTHAILAFMGLMESKEDLPC